MGSLDQEEEEEEVQLHKHHLYKMSLQILAVDMVSLPCSFSEINFSASLSLQQAFRSLSRNSQGAGGRNGVELPEGGTPNIAHSLKFRFRAF